MSVIAGWALSQCAEEPLGQPVQAGAVQVTYAGGVPGVEDDTRLSVEVFDGPLGAELVTRRGDVCRATESGQAEADPLRVADHTPAQLLHRQLLRQERPGPSDCHLGVGVAPHSVYRNDDEDRRCVTRSGW
jgi:hypothetical protein